MITYIITLILGMIIGIMLYRKFFKNNKELTTDELLTELQNRNYWVRIGPKGGKE